MNSGPPLGREGGVADFPNKLGLKKDKVGAGCEAKTKHPPDTFPVSFIRILPLLQLFSFVCAKFSSYI